MLCAKVAELVLPMANKSGGGGGGSKSDEARVRDVGVPLAAVLDARLQPSVEELLRQIFDSRWLGLLLWLASTEISH